MLTQKPLRFVVYDAFGGMEIVMSFFSAELTSHCYIGFIDGEITNAMTQHLKTGNKSSHTVSIDLAVQQLCREQHGTKTKIRLLSNS